MPISLRRSKMQSASTQQPAVQDRRQPTEAPSPPRSPDSSSTSTTARQLGVPLAPVHETNRASSPRRPPPSAFRAVPPMAGRGAKGKERDDSGPAQQRFGRAPWVCDSDESRRGAGIWQQSDRVILVLGDVSRAVLAPLLYSSVFSDTLILVGSISPIPEIEALNSPSQLLNASDGRTIYPTIQPFVVPPALLATTTPQSAILQQGAVLANASRRTGSVETPAGLPARTGMASRRGSASSLRSIGGTQSPTPPPTRRRLLSFGRSSSTESPLGSPRGSTTDLSALGHQPGRPGSAAGDHNEERPGLRQRLSALIRNDIGSREGSPFDAVLNFIPSPPYNLDPQRALQEMLQYTVVLTSAAMPILMSAVTDNSVTSSLAMTELAPLSLVHIVPVDAPPALAPVIERFLLPLLPTMGKRVRRDLFGIVTGLGAWLAPQSDPLHNGLPGAETILFGGVRCPEKNVTEEYRQQAMLAGWDHCQLVPGMLVEMEREEPAPVFSKRASALELSNLRTSRTGHSRETSMSSMVSTHSASPPLSPPMAATAIAAPVAAQPLANGARAASPPRPASAASHTRQPSNPRNNAPAVQQTPATRGSPTLPTNAQPAQNAFTSRFDPRFMDNSVRMKNTTSTSPRMANRSLPPGAAAARETKDMPDMSFGLNGNANGNGHANGNGNAYANVTQSNQNGTAKKRSPSGLRYNVTLPQSSLQPSPPTPELDTSGSSCSSSSVIEPSWNTEKAQQARRPSHGLMRNMSSRKGFGFTSLFRRNSVRA